MSARPCILCRSKGSLRPTPGCGYCQPAVVLRAAAVPPPALTFGSATAALALLGRAAGPAHAADVDALQALLSAVAGALRAPSDAPLVEALLAALGRRP